MHTRGWSIGDRGGLRPHFCAFSGMCEHFCGIKKLQEDINEQMQRRLQASKALDICQSKDEFEGSCERVEFERLLVRYF